MLLDNGGKNKVSIWKIISTICRSTVTNFLVIIEPNLPSHRVLKTCQLVAMKFQISPDFEIIIFLNQFWTTVLCAVPRVMSNNVRPQKHTEVVFKT